MLGIYKISMGGAGGGGSAGGFSDVSHIPRVVSEYHMNMLS